MPPKSKQGKKRNKRGNAKQVKAVIAATKPAKPAKQAKPKKVVPLLDRPAGGILASLGKIGLNLADKHFLGGAAGKLFDTLTGHGDYVASAAELPYDINANTIIHPKMTPTVPLMNDDRGATRIRHREYLTNVTTTTAFSLSPYRLQPGDSKTFPWMAPIARLYQQYKFLGVVFEFVTTSGTFSAPSPALGQVMMATQYNVTQPVFSTQQSMLNTYFSCSGVPAVSLMHAVECEAAEQPYQLYFVRNPGVTPTDIKDPGGPSYEVRDPHLFDFGIFQFASSGGPVPADGFVSGQLWITYDVMLYKPVLPELGFGSPPLQPPIINDYDRESFGMVSQEAADATWHAQLAEHDKISHVVKRPVCDNDSLARAARRDEALPRPVRPSGAWFG